MNHIVKSFVAVVVLFIMALPALSQGRPGSSGSSAGSGSGASVGAGSRAVVASPSSVRSFPSTSGARIGGTSVSVPRLQGTSFATVNTWIAWQTFYSYLSMQYLLSGNYFNRFYRNVEPLVTPQLLRLTTREPLRLSMEMMNAADQLEALLQDRQAGKPVTREQIADKAQEIRDLSKRIRHDQALTFIDQRKEMDLLKGDSIESKGMEAISQLREMATDLNTQLREMYSQSSTSTVSVTTLTQPSLASLSKGIEKLSKVIESSAKKI